MKISKTTHSELNVSETLKCPICSNEANNQILQYEEKMFRMEGLFNYINCSNCNAISIIRPPEDLARYYPPADYYSVAPISVLRQTLMHLRDLAYIYRYPGSSLIRKYLPNSALETTLAATFKKRTSRILDVGCGNGALLKSLARLGMSSLTGVDPLIEKDHLVGKIRLLRGDLCAVKGVFDVITFHHSLEHIQDPKKILSEAKDLLSTQGIILVRIPTRDSLASLMYGDDWFQIDAPRHMCLHSHKSIKFVANEAGLKVAKVICDSQPMQFWASDLYRDGLQLSSHKARRKYQKRNRSFYRELTHYCNSNLIGDQIVVTLIKDH